MSTCGVARSSICGQIPEIGVLPVTGAVFYGQIPEIGVLPVSQSWALIEQAMRSTVFDKKVCFHASKLKNAGQNFPLFGI